MLKTSSKTDDITKFDTGLRFRTLLICNPAVNNSIAIKMYCILVQHVTNI